MHGFVVSSVNLGSAFGSLIAESNDYYCYTIEYTNKNAIVGRENTATYICIDILHVKIVRLRNDVFL